MPSHDVGLGISPEHMDEPPKFREHSVNNGISAVSIPPQQKQELGMMTQASDLLPVIGAIL